MLTVLLQAQRRGQVSATTLSCRAKRDLINDDNLLRHLKASEPRGSKIANLLNRLVEVLAW